MLIGTYVIARKGQVTLRAHKRATSLCPLVKKCTHVSRSRSKQKQGRHVNDVTAFWRGLVERAAGTEHWGPASELEPVPGLDRE